MIFGFVRPVLSVSICTQGSASRVEITAKTVIQRESVSNVRKAMKLMQGFVCWAVLGLVFSV